MPNLGSASSMECPPRIRARARDATSPAPRITSPNSSSISGLRGHPTRFSANSGVAPIAYRSLNAFAAAIAPKLYASSTIGVKKSTVATMARSSVRRKTAASSRVSAPTMTRGSSTIGK